MDVGQVTSGYKWIIDANHNDLPERAELAKQGDAGFSIPLTEEDCALIGISLLEQYSFENIADIISAIQTMTAEAGSFFQNASQLYQRDNYSAAQAEFERAVLRYSEILELYTVLIAIVQTQTTDVFSKALPEFIQNKETVQHNLQVAQQNARTAAQAVDKAHFVTDDTSLVEGFRRAQALYNQGIQAYNEKRYTEALTIFSEVERQCQELFVLLSNIEEKYPAQDVSTRRAAIEELSALSIKAKALAQELIQ